MEPSTEKQLKSCPYLSTVKKHLLDFDFEKVCSVSMAHTNIYVCLVCGRYFQGRSASSPAYQHSIEHSHYVFMNLENGKVYCLPDGYQVEAHTIRDIQFNLQPHYSVEKLTSLEEITEPEYNMDGKEFYPGIIGMNNLGKTDYATSIIYLLNCIKPIRRYFLLNSAFNEDILKHFSLLLKKIWNPFNFKGVINPHQFLQYVTNKSEKKFKIGTGADPVTFFIWLVDNLSRAIKKNHKKDNFQLNSLFKGTLKTSLIKGVENSYQYEQIPTKVQETPFMVLRLQFPEKGIFNKTQSQIQIKELLLQYEGKKGQKHADGLRYAKIIIYPQYLILVFKRFIKNEYKVEKDSTNLLYRDNLNIEGNQYKLIGQVCHDGEVQTGKYRVIFSISRKWYQIEDLQTKEINQRQVILSQPYIQVYQKQIR